MTAPKFAKRRDNNEPELVAVAARLGWKLWKMDEPADWLALKAGRWHVVEIKNPDQEGDADEYTPKQKIFHTDVKNSGGKILIWRWVEDVVRDSNALVERVEYACTRHGILKSPDCDRCQAELSEKLCEKKL